MMKVQVPVLLPKQFPQKTSTATVHSSHKCDHSPRSDSLREPDNLMLQWAVRMLVPTSTLSSEFLHTLVHGPSKHDAPSNPPSKHIITRGGKENSSMSLSSIARVRFAQPDSMSRSTSSILSSKKVLYTASRAHAVSTLQERNSVMSTMTMS